MIILKPKTEKSKKQCAPVTEIKVYLTPGKKLIITGNGYLNRRRVELMTSDDGKKLYLCGYDKGFNIQFDKKSSWSIPTYNEDVKRALVKFIDKGAAPVTSEIVEFRGTRQKLLCATAPEPKPEPVVSISPQQITVDEYNEFIEFKKAKAAGLLNIDRR